MFYESLSIGLFFSDYKSPLIYISHYLVVFLLFYFHGDFVLPTARKNKQTAKYLLVFFVIAELVIYIALQYLVTIILAAIELTVLSGKEFNITFVLRNMYRGILFMGFSTGYYFLSTYLLERKKTEELEKERLEKIIQQQNIEQELIIAQNAFLKAQINPHFLFNTLNFVYHKVNDTSKTAGEAIIKLAEMMRFSIDSDQMGTTIRLIDELQQVENLLYLNQIRRNEDLNVHLEYAEEVKNLQLIPLLVLTLVENIFKHGDLSDPEEIAYISLNLNNGALQIRTRNVVNQSKVKNSTQSGLNNIKKRLHYHYGNEVHFNNRIVENYFEVEINIPVQLLKQPI